MTAADARRRVIQSSASNPSESPFQNTSAGNGYLRESQALHEHASLQSFENRVDDFIAQGRAVLDNLTDQRDILKGTHRRVIDAVNTLGLSRDVINWIERRSKQDTYIFLSGALFTLVAFYYIWKWFG
jgi:Golgi SNAP receptor complex protein 2